MTMEFFLFVQSNTPSTFVSFGKTGFELRKILSNVDAIFYVQI